MITGNITLSGIDDADLIHILEFKKNHSGVFTFNPQTLQAATINEAATTGQGLTQRQVYNGAVLAWTHPSGLKLVQDILHKLQPHHPS